MEVLMADKQLQGLKVAILATDGVEQVELLKPREALKDAGAETKVVSPNTIVRSSAVVVGQRFERGVP
jgi:putative intracellular protease/amidase